MPVRKKDGSYGLTHFNSGKVIHGFHKKGWLLKGLDGQPVVRYQLGVYKSYFDPSHPEFQKFYVDFMVEAVEFYQVEGIIVDDHFSVPRDFGCGS